MPHLITDECLNCGECESVCPNNAIYAKGEVWMLGDSGIYKDYSQKALLFNGEKIAIGELRPPIEDDRYFIVPEKCTSCRDQKEVLCIKVCPQEKGIILDEDLVPFDEMTLYTFDKEALSPDPNERRNKHPKISKTEQLSEVHSAANQTKAPSPTGEDNTHAILLELKESIWDSIGREKLLQELKTASIVLREIHHEDTTTVLLLSSDLERLNQEYKQNTIARGEYKAEYNRLIERLLNTLGQW